MPLSLLLLSLWMGTAAAATSPLPAASIAHREKVAPSPAARYALGHGLQATVVGHTLVIKNANGTIITRNEQLIRLADENSSCPSEGFERIVAKGDYFTIEQQTCGGWSFVQEYITFHYVPASGQLMLHKYGRVATDRRNPNKIIPANVYTTKQLGQRPLAQVTKAALDAIE